MKKKTDNLEVKSYFFYSYLPKTDFDLLMQFALKIRDEKNKLSEYISSNMDILEGIYNGKISINTFTKKVNSLRKINDSVAYQQLVRNVFTTYESIFSKLEYKGKNKSHLREKNLILKFRLIPKADFLNLMNKYLKKDKNNNLVKDTINLVNTTDIFKEVQDYINDYLKYRSEHPVKFESLTFSSINVLKKGRKMLYEQHKANTNAVFLLNLPNRGEINIKTRYSKVYHDDLETFKVNVQRNKQIKMNYQIKFLNNKRIKLTLTKESEKSPNILNKTNIAGIDVNTKHNLFYFSNGYIMRYDNELIYKEKGLRKYLAKMAYHKAKRHNKERNKKARLREEKQARRRKFHQDLKSSLAVKYAKKNNINHIVMEDVNFETKGVKLKKNKNLKGMNYNHIQVAIHISDMKNSVQRMCKREGIQFSLVNARYTSKTCPVCGHIHDDNRKTQEHFKCVRCGFSMNADHVAALNIALRMHVPELRSKLQYFDTTDKMYKGKGYKEREKFQNIYEEVYKNEIAMNEINSFIVRNSMGKAC